MTGTISESSDRSKKILSGTPLLSISVPVSFRVLQMLEGGVLFGVSIRVDCVGLAIEMNACLVCMSQRSVG